ncbi:ATP-grasp domain-containing protein [bacterium]|nr:ATP-grasp domain-containing protein [bacterium]
MKKTLMIIGAGIMQVPVISTASRMGLYVVVTDYNFEAVGMNLADFAIVMSTKDIEGSVRAAREFNERQHIDGVITVGTDASMTVAAVANALELPGIKFESAEAATNKFKMRKRFAKFGVPSPNFYQAWDLLEAYEAASKIGYPLVIKPVDNMGARGITGIKKEDDLRQAFHRAKSASPSGEIVIEEFMPGPELSIDVLIYNRKVIFFAIADRIIEPPPYFVELGHTLPSNLPKKKQEEALEVMNKGIKALGINTGAAKGDIKITPDGPKVVELAARLSGGFMSGYTLPLSTGVNIIKAAIELALGEKPSLDEKRLNRVSVERAIIPAPGKVVSIKGVEEAKEIKGIEEIIINTAVGETLDQVTSNIGKAANVITVGRTRKEAERLAEAAMKIVEIEVGAPPLLSLEEIKKRARNKFKQACRVCSVCDGRICAGKVPGMGGAGTGSSFKANLEALARFKINVKTIHSITSPDISCEILGLSLSMPILAAPIIGTTTNMGGAISQDTYTKSVVDGCRAAGTIAMVGDGARVDHYQGELANIHRANGWGIAIFKPRSDQREILTRIKAAEQVGAVACGIDLDAACLTTMITKGQSVGPKSVQDLKDLIRSTSLPFIIKGIMTVPDAERAVEAGAKAIVVSNHGGRVLDYMPGALDVLPQIVKAVGKEITILVDGGIRSGLDVLKCLALGAKAVLIGRPVAIAAVGGEREGVKLLLESYEDELKEAMILTGQAKVGEISEEVIFKG